MTLIINYYDIDIKQYMDLLLFMAELFQSSLESVDGEPFFIFNVEACHTYMYTQGTEHVRTSVYAITRALKC